MIEAVLIAAAFYLVVALLAFGALAMHPHADEFRPMRALGAAFVLVRKRFAFVVVHESAPPPMRRACT